jgi:hypothetical protein
MNQLNLPRPVAHFRRITDYYTCPECGDVIASCDDVTEYAERTDDEPSLRVASVTRTFRPCGCKVTALTAEERTVQWDRPTRTGVEEVQAITSTLVPEPPDALTVEDR